jgi:hypothetical protein
VTDEDRNAEIASIVREREAYKKAGDKQNFAHCEDVLRRLAPQRTPPARATRKRGV